MLLNNFSQVSFLVVTKAFQMPVTGNTNTISGIHTPCWCFGLASIILEILLFRAEIFSPQSLCHTLGIVCPVSPVSTITTRKNEDIKSIFDANVYHVPGLCF